MTCLAGGTENEVNLGTESSQLCHAMIVKIVSHGFFDSARAAPAFGAEGKLANVKCLPYLTSPAGMLPLACVCSLGSPFLGFGQKQQA